MSPVDIKEGLKKGELIELDYDQLAKNLGKENRLRKVYLELKQEGLIRAFLIIESGDVAFTLTD